MTKNLVEVLGIHPFFEGFSPEQIEFIAECASDREYAEGEFLFREGVQANEFYLVTEGQIAIEVFHTRGEAKILQTVRRGEIIGWSWIVEPRRYAFDALATRPVRTIAFDAKRMLDRFEQDSTLGYLVLQKFAKVISERLGHTWLQLMDVYSQEQQ